jgi:pyruvate ferredoxin oxidoreductase gamma subunit
VLDSSLIHLVGVTSGLKEGGTIIINTRRSFEDIEKEIGSNWKLATIDASGIARQVLGVPIVNTTMIGALLKTTDIFNLEAMVEPLNDRFGHLAEKNINAMRRAYNETKVKEL